MRTRPAAMLSVSLLAAGTLALAPTGSAAGHGDTIHSEISALIDGHTRTVATWENDRDPVTEPLAATLGAVAADGRAVGPWRLVAVPGDPGAFTTREHLPPAIWKVTVESGFPALGRGTTTLKVTAVPGTAPATGPTEIPTSVLALLRAVESRPDPQPEVQRPATPLGSGEGAR
ncbi:hypothetical protein [Kitasatospora camelliae]|uniref:Uncharacterized protein n=1 Tax=Kitasatospora camelliae TaxID=3156397 RepID=A0AAU8JN46_9ACTN